jgi:hypothetical protein
VAAAAASCTCTCVGRSSRLSTTAWMHGSTAETARHTAFSSGDTYSCQEHTSYMHTTEQQSSSDFELSLRSAFKCT